MPYLTSATPPSSIINNKKNAIKGHANYYGLRMPYNDQLVGGSIDWTVLEENTLPDGKRKLSVLHVLQQNIKFLVGRVSQIGTGDQQVGTGHRMQEYGQENSR